MPLFYPADAARFARFLEGVPVHRRRKLLLTLPTVGRIAADTGLLAADLADDDVDLSGCRTWQQFHDTLVLARRSLNRILNRPTPAHPISGALNGQQTAGLRLAAATSSDELDDWGNAMHNCIGSYAAEAIVGDVVLFGNLSVGWDGRVWECLGKYNRILPRATERAVRDLVRIHVDALPPSALDGGAGGESAA